MFLHKCKRPFFFIFFRFSCSSLNLYKLSQSCFLSPSYSGSIMHLSILYQVPITPIKHSYFATLPCFTPSFSAVCPLFNGSFYVVFCIAYVLFFFQTLIKANKKGVSAFCLALFMLLSLAFHLLQICLSPFVNRMRMRSHLHYV